MRTVNKLLMSTSVNLKENSKPTNRNQRLHTKEWSFFGQFRTIKETHPFLSITLVSSFSPLRIMFPSTR